MDSVEHGLASLRSAREEPRGSPAFWQGVQADPLIVALWSHASNSSGARSTLGVDDTKKEGQPSRGPRGTLTFFGQKFGDHQAGRCGLIDLQVDKGRGRGQGLIKALADKRGKRAPVTP